MATACWCCCVYDPSPPTSYPHTPPPQWMTKKKIPFLISSDRAWPRLPWEGSMVAWWGLLRPQGNMMGRRGGKKKGATSTIRSQTRRSRMPHGAPFRLPSLVSTVADGDLTGGKKTWLMAIARGFNIRLCGLWWDGLRVSYLLSNTDPLPTEVWPIYWLPNSDFLRSVRARLRNKRFTRPETFISGTVKVICWTSV